ncbi:MAG: hypothetical protein ABSA69_06170 [Verrucomicrobiota bacterium]|jgi:hypothetical protein
MQILVERACRCDIGKYLAFYRQIRKQKIAYSPQKGQILTLPAIAHGPERGIYAASSFGRLQVNRFVSVRSDTEAA